MTITSIEGNVKSAKLFVAATGVLTCLAITGCGAGEEDQVATIDDRGAVSVDGYVNQATAEYAECLKELGLSVAPEDHERAAELTGYVKIENATLMTDAGGSVELSDLPIAVDGEDRDAEIRECRSKYPSSKDVLLDQADFVGLPPEPIPAGEIQAGQAWAECARAAGVSSIEDPDKLGYVLIGPDVTLAEAEKLGEQCSVPMVDDESWPQFHYDGVGVPDPETGLLKIDPFARAIDGPFLDSPRAKKAREAAEQDATD